MSSLNSLTLLEISTAMKRTSLSKSVRTFGLMAMLSAVVATTLQQTIQAQTPSAINPALKIACVPMAEGEFIYALKDIELSPKQFADFDRISKSFSKPFADIGDNPVGRVEGKLAYTPVQIATLNKLNLEYFDQFASIFPPTQKKIFLTNLLRVWQVEACDGPKQALDPAYKDKAIVDIAAGNPELSTLVKAVKAAGLTETLSSKTPLTVFAPTNKAFAALPKGTLEKLLKPENRETLRKVLTYHVVSGAAESQILQSGVAKSVEGSSINVQVSGIKIKVNKANVTLADVKTSNGIIHVIDQVILPPGLKL
jgi:uncharacterized surface protein with fasciclin (FAS1) repeats